MRQQRRLGGGGRQRGMSLVEVMIAMGISIAMLTALAVMFQNNVENQAELEKTISVTENVRYAIESITEDIRHAGFYGELNTVNVTVSYQTPAPCATTAATQGWDLAPLASSGTALMPAAIFGFSNNAHGCLSNQSSAAGRQEGITVVHTDTGPSLAARSAGNFYLHPSRCSEDVAPVELVDSGSTLSLRNLNCSAVYGLVRRVQQRTYYLSDCEDCSPSDGIMSLKRAEYIDGAFQVLTVSEGIERLVFEYGLDTDGNGSLNEWVQAAGVDGSAGHAWNNVIAVRFTVLGRADEASKNFVDNKTYALGTQTYTPNDAFKRVVMTATVRLSNVAGRLEK